jgi:germination protein M
MFTGRMTRVVAATVVLLALFAAGCSSDDVATEPAATAEATPTPEATEALESTPSSVPTASPEPTAATEEGEAVVNVHWLRDTQLAVGGRLVPTPAVATGAIEQLLLGPNTLETEIDMVSAVPPGTELRSINIADGVATIDFSSEFEASGLGTSGETGLVAQVVYTLTQFPTVDSVNIQIEGEDRDTILSHGLEARGLTREAFHDSVMPAILVESPYPGEPVTSPLTVEGLSRTFEANVQYAVTIPPSGEIADEGFTTANQPDIDQFGPFEFTAEFEVVVGGFGAVIVFEESAKDGTQINVYEVPVVMEP